MNAELRRKLESAYSPCKNFAADCRGLIKPWNAASGHVPRGFYGALGELSEIRLVIVLAEPADPASNEDYSSKGREMELAFSYAEKCYLYCGSDGHDNVRKIVRSCFPSLELLDAMRKVWITESVLCSALTSGGNIRVACVGSLRIGLPRSAASAIARGQPRHHCRSNGFESLCSSKSSKTSA